MSTATDMLQRVNMRERRADSLASGIMQALDDFLPHRYHREVYDALRVMLLTEGVEVLTDWDREQVGLPPRGPEGWTNDELIAMERRRLEILTKPLSFIVPNNPLI